MHVVCVWERESVCACLCACVRVCAFVDMHMTLALYAIMYVQKWVHACSSTDTGLLRRRKRDAEREREGERERERERGGGRQKLLGSSCPTQTSTHACLPRSPNHGWGDRVLLRKQSRVYHGITLPPWESTSFWPLGNGSGSRCDQLDAKTSDEGKSHRQIPFEGGIAPTRTERQQQSSSSSSNRFIEHDVSTRKLGPSSGRRTLLLTVKPARMSVKTNRKPFTTELKQWPAEVCKKKKENELKIIVEQLSRREWPSLEDKLDEQTIISLPRCSPRTSLHRTSCNSAMQVDHHVDQPTATQLGPRSSHVRERSTRLESRRTVKPVHQSMRTRRDRKVVWILQSDPWHVTEIGHPFGEESREKGVDRGNDGLARRVCLLFRPSSVRFSFISWTKMFTKENESVNFEGFVWWAVNLDFFPTLLKSMENSTFPSRILWHFQAQAST